MIPSPVAVSDGFRKLPEGQNMSDVKIEIEGDSDAAVALALLRMIAVAEGKEEDGDRGWYLETYAACLAVVRDADVMDLDDEDEDEEEGEAEPAEA
jgi:hypothetical protein